MLHAKKSLGQHFLNDNAVVENIIAAFNKYYNNSGTILEIGPGMGVLTEHLFKSYRSNVFVCELDARMTDHLKKKYPQYSDNVIEQDILQLDFKKYFPEQTLAVIGNFPYNISTEIIFKVLDNRDMVPYLVGMFQKEVARRFASVHGNKEYGITSVLAQAYYDIEYLFDIGAESFSPPPKVKSGVIRMTKRTEPYYIKDETLLRKLVKAGFNQRRKTLRNALSSFNISSIQKPIFGQRAEQLSVQEWIGLSNELSNNG